jgi:hypothetical protein
MMITLVTILLVGAGVGCQTIRQRYSKVADPIADVSISDPALVGEPPKVQRSQLVAMKSIGIDSIRFDADWSMVQPDGPRQFDWTELDQAVDSARAAGISVDLIIDGCPSWAALPGTRGDHTPVPASPHNYARWAANVAARYAPRGVNLFEIWNEPNAADTWSPRASPSAYTADLIAAYSAIKAVDRSAFIISGGLAPAATNGRDFSPIDFLKAMYADGAKGSFDALGYHAYSYPVLPDTYEPWSGWSQMDQTNPSLRSIMKDNGDSDKPIWITEFGAPTEGPHGVGETAQATAISQAISAVRITSWLGALYVYTWQDSGNNPNTDEDWFGILTARGKPKFAYAVIRAARSHR